MLNILLRLATFENLADLLFIATAAWYDCLIFLCGMYIINDLRLGERSPVSARFQNVRFLSESPLFLGTDPEHFLGWSCSMYF